MTPDPAVVTQAYANAAARPLAVPVPVPAVPPDQRPLFQSMFSDRGNQPVAQAVSSLWTPPDADAQVKMPALSLFSDPPASERKPGKI